MASGERIEEEFKTQLLLVAGFKLEEVGKMGMLDRATSFRPRSGRSC